MCTHRQFTAEGHAEGFNAVNTFDASLSVISLLHVRLSRVIKIILTYLLKNDDGLI